MNVSEDRKIPGSEVKEYQSICEAKSRSKSSSVAAKCISKDLLRSRGEWSIKRKTSKVKKQLRKHANITSTNDCTLKLEKISGPELDAQLLQNH